MKKIFLLWLLTTFFLVGGTAFAEDLKLAGGGTVEATVINPLKGPFEKATGIKIRFLKVGSKAAFAELLKGNVEASTADVSFDDLTAIAKKEKMEIGDPSEYKHTIIGKDSLIFFIHKSNTLKKLSKEQLKGICTGRITNWKEVGGKNEPILLVFGKLSSGTNSLVARHILDGESLSKDVLEVNTADDVKESVVVNPESIGFGPTSMLDGTIASPETPEISRPLILVTRGNPSSNVGKLLEFINREGQKYIK